MRLRASILTALMTCAQAQATNLAVSPLRLDLDSQHAIGALTITNQGDSDIVVQTDVQHWQQSGNEDHFDTASGLMITPALFRLRPGSHQIIRVGWRQLPAPGPATSTYRLFLSEVPTSTGGNSSGLRMGLRLSLPLFMHWPNERPMQLTWHQAPAVGDQPGTLMLSNPGGQPARITRILLNGDQALPDQLIYVLPGNRYSLGIPAGLGIIHQVRAVGDDGPLPIAPTAP